MGVSYATVNRWENEQSTPRPLAWRRIEELAREGLEGFGQVAEPSPEYGAPEAAPEVDFGADPELVGLVAEAERLSYGHLFNPSFATEISLIDPLPHQRLAVYEHMLVQPRLRFLLADDAGAGKTVMTGLYVREMLARRLIRRVLIAPPAGLIGNWRREMRRLFRLPFEIVTGSDARDGNPFVGPDSDLVIVSVDTLAGERTFARLQELGGADAEPYDLVVFDEAHKLSADHDPRRLALRRTDRYRLGEALAGVRVGDPRWQLAWSPRHFLLLTATPHMGKDFPYYSLWRLLEPEGLPTYEAFEGLTTEQRQRHFLRRTKEEMVYFDGRKIYPTRISDTLAYELTQGDGSEQELYDETTSYLRSYYNRARVLNRSAARLAMGVFQRRLASSTYALLRSLERRLERIDKMTVELESGQLSLEGLFAQQRRLDGLTDPLDEKTADEEGSEAGLEEHERTEDELLGAVVAESVAELEVERQKVQELIELARRVDGRGDESKFERLAEVVGDPDQQGEKLLIFTEHRDTLDYLVRRLEGMGFAGQIASIHGGMDFQQREEQVEFFRNPTANDGALVLVATDAAGEGINLQFCWRMVNYDVPWNPARLEQRMGRIHRYGQKHDPVLIMNLVAHKTREGRVLRTLLDKLELIRKELRSDKVFDVIGRIFEDVSLKDYMEQALTEDGAEARAAELDRLVTAERVQASDERERRIYGTRGEVEAALPRLRDALERDVLRRLIPGHVRGFLQKAAPRLNLDIEGSLDGEFRLRPGRDGAMDPLLAGIDTFARDLRLSVARPDEGSRVLFLHPGEPVFERLRSWVCDEFSREALRGGAFVDPTAEDPYLFHLFRVEVVRQAAPELPALSSPELLECVLVGVRESEEGVFGPCPLEHLLLLKGTQTRPATARPFVATAASRAGRAVEHVTEQVASQRASSLRNSLLQELPEREAFLRKGYDHETAQVAARRIQISQRAREGDPQAKRELEVVRGRQKSLSDERDRALAALHREPDLVATGSVVPLVRALIFPSTSPEDRERHDAESERIAMQLAAEYERSQGSRVRDVSKPQLAREADLTDSPGFDLLSVRRDGSRRCIEVKGRARTGSVEVSEGEWAAACTLRNEFWLYVAFNCATPQPELLRVKDPFGSLLAKQKGAVLIDASQIRQEAEDAP